MNIKEALELESSSAKDENQLLVIAACYWLQLVFDDMVMESFDDYYQD